MIQEADMTAPRSIHVVVAFDFSPSAEEALARAMDVALRAPQHVLHVVAALEPSGLVVGSRKGTTYASADQLRISIAEHVHAIGAGRTNAEAVQFYVHARIGKPAEEILQVAEDVGADLIFVGSHGKVGLERLLLGSVSERIAREAGCPVMVVRAKTYRDVVLPTVTTFEHERKPFHPPHRFAYANNRVIHHPDDWPLG
jgi:nucleotide-binding universal stress UspA family protein